MNPAGMATILLCEADLALREFMCERLTSEGYRVLCENSAEAAMVTLDAQRPDLIISDVELKNSDGMALLFKLRHLRPDLDDLPFIIISEFSEPEDIAAGRDAGADDFLAKPVDGDLMVSTIRGALRRNARIRDAIILHRSTRGRAAQNGAYAGALEAALDRLSFGIALFDEKGEPAFINRAALKLTSTGPDGILRWLSKHAGLPEHPGWWGSQPGQHHHADNAFLVPLASGANEEDPGWCVVTTSTLPAIQGTSTTSSTRENSGPQNSHNYFVAMIFGGAVNLANQIGGDLVGAAAGLTPTESSVANLLIEGYRPRDIAERLSIATTTVNFHLRNIFQKTATSRQSELIALLRCVQLAPPPNQRS